MKKALILGGVVAVLGAGYYFIFLKKKKESTTTTADIKKINFADIKKFPTTAAILEIDDLGKKNTFSMYKNK